MTKIGNIEFENIPVILAPMDDVTGFAFREICKQHGADLMFTEFVSSEALIRGVEKSLKKITVPENHRPIGIQIFGNNIDSIIQATILAEQNSPDLIDLNFGCPVKKLVGKGCGAALLKDIDKMVSIAEAAVKSTALPITVKTRLGWDEKNKNIVDVAERLQDVGIAAITIHGRTRSQQYSGEADWTLIGEVKNNPRMHIPVIGNGDINSPQKAKEMLNRYHVDGLMIGRASIGNPWLFNEIKSVLFKATQLSVPSLREKVDVCRQHLEYTIQE
ncbi:MAG: tRNA dihydrouridine synthase DusB, partial [Odoribacter sp.]|nr:tRNA dihydrouridine synthase DusB [Odoribacter sp.]